jgi:hypothetical protein
MRDDDIEAVDGAAQKDHDESLRSALGGARGNPGCQQSRAN